MNLLYSMIFNVTLLSVCAFDGTLFASPKTLENAYKSCGMNGPVYAARLKSSLQEIASSPTQDDIFDLIKRSLPCVNCDFCHKNIETAAQNLFDTLGMNSKKRVKRLRYFVISSVLQSCKQHECSRSYLSQARNKQSLRLQIQDDYQDYQDEWEDQQDFFAVKKDRAERNRAYKQRKKQRKFLEQLELQELEFEQQQARFDELFQEIDDQLASDYARSLSWSDDQYDMSESQDDEPVDEYDNQEDDGYDDEQEDEQEDEELDFYNISKSRGYAKWSKPKKG